MKLKIIFALIFVLLTIGVRSKNIQQKFEKSVFYEVMSSGRSEDVNKELEVVSASSSPEKDGYEGALLMRKAGLATLPSQKLKYFKQGRIKFDTAISNDKDNAEFHFLRFAIQEHAPKIVKYNADLEADRLFIIKAYKNLSPVVQHAIMDYTKKSKILKAEDL